MADGAYTVVIRPVLPSHDVMRLRGCLQDANTGGEHLGEPGTLGRSTPNVVHGSKDAEPLLDAFGVRGLHRESFMMNSAS
ncbi:hypothetical protein [Streptomyces acidiscabies]|uniref:hypothetical protein n=1 Tax=Streptomyces acidiscabies TaxID=42234 RepID=UPI0038F81308